MRSTSAKYKTLRETPGSWYEVQIVRGTTIYGPDKLKSCKIETAMFDKNGPQIGNTMSAQCTVVMVESKANWPRMAEFKVRVRIQNQDSTDNSEWLNMGTFYTDEKSEDKYGNLTIIGFDAMLMAGQTWMEKAGTLPANWPVTSRVAAGLICRALGFTLDGATTMDDSVAWFGINTESTGREALSWIAAAEGKNWIVTPDNTFRLVTLSNENPIGGDPIYWVNENNRHITSSKGDLIFGTVGGTECHVMSLDIGESVDTVSSVVLTDSTGNVSSAGYTDGYQLTANCEFSNTSVANVALSNAAGYSYRPFEASGAILDPAAEVGDTVIVQETPYQIAGIDWTINSFITATIRAPWEEEVDHEYTFETSGEKALRLVSTKVDSDEVESLIEQNAGRIRMMADKIVWEATNSSMSEDGVLTCQGANISGNLELMSGDMTANIGEYTYDYYNSTTGGTQTETITGFVVEDGSGGSYAVGSKGHNYVKWQSSDRSSDIGSRKWLDQVDYSDVTGSRWITEITQRGHYERNIRNISSGVSRSLIFGEDGFGYGEVAVTPGTGDLIGHRIIRGSPHVLVGLSKFDVAGTSYTLTLTDNSFQANGNTVAYESTSSKRYKHDISNVLSDENDPHRLYDLPVKQFVYNDDHKPQYDDMRGKTIPGFIAEDVESVYPNAVIYHDGEVESWDERRIIPGMLALIQEQKQEIDTLKKQVGELLEVIRNAKNL